MSPHVRYRYGDSSVPAGESGEEDVNQEQLRQLGHKVVEVRKAKGWNQAALAEQAGMTDTTIRKIERGDSVSAKYLRRVLDVLEIEPLAETYARVGYPADVELVRDLIGMYLVAIPQEDRAGVAHDITAFLMERSRSRPTQQ